jgi:hypothetical protein
MRVCPGPFLLLSSVFIRGSLSAGWEPRMLCIKRWCLAKMSLMKSQSVVILVLASLCLVANAQLR